MQHQLILGGLLLHVVALIGQGALADDEGEERWGIEAELEIGVEAIVASDDADAKVSDVFLSGELDAVFALSDRIGLFTTLNFESVTDPERDRMFDDLGFYVGELGLVFDFDPVTVRLGKISPTFGSAWDVAPGYFGAEFAEEYEIEEVIGLAAEIEIGDGLLSMSAFYPDDSRLSDSFGTRRGRNDRSEGGVGNTGKLNNFALQYDHTFDATTLHFGLSHHAQGQENMDETGFALGVTQTLGEDVELIAEYAGFKGWEGNEANASIATLGASLTQGEFTYNAAISQRRISEAPSDYLIALGVDHTFENDMTLSIGLARTREEEENATAFAMSLSIPFE